MKGWLGISATFLLFGLSAGHGQHTTWTGGVLGDWFDEDNWTDGVPVGGAFGAASALVDTGLAVIGPGSPTAASGDLIVGGTPSAFTAGLGISGSDLLAYGVEVGRDSGASGLFAMSGSSSVLNYLGSTIGGAGIGVLTLTGTSTYSTTGVVIGQSAGGEGTVEVNGAGSIISFFSLDVDADLVIGAGGSGSLKLLNGGRVGGNADLFVSMGQGGGAGALEVSGTGSRLLAENFNAGNATIEVRNGGRIDVWDNFQVLGDVILTISSQGRIGVGDVLTLSDTATLVFTLGGALPEGYGELYADQLSLNGTFQIALTSGFQPTLGDSFSLLDFTLADGAFDAFDLPDLTPGLFWDTSSLATDGVLRVVPEPSVVLLLAAGLGWLGVCHRNRKKSGPARPEPDQQSAADNG